MPRVKTASTQSELKPRMRPALSPEAREKQMIALAEECAEEQMRNRTASSQIICHYLSLATERERLKREAMELENQLTKAKTEAIKAEENNKADYKEVLAAFRIYSGHGGDDDEDERYDSDL